MEILCSDGTQCGVVEHSSGAVAGGGKTQGGEFLEKVDFSFSQLYVYTDPNFHFIIF